MLTDQQQRLHDAVLNEAKRTGDDTRDLLLADRTAPAEDKAAVADVLGGPGAGDEFR